DRNLLQMILTETQRVRAGTGGQASTVRERDGAGSYMAAYEMPQPDVIVKRKLKYVDTDGVAGAPGAVRVAIDQSELRFTLDARSRVIALNGTERVRMGVAAAQPAASPRGQLATTIHIQLSNFRTGQA